jgi:hypothetical protein
VQLGLASPACSSACIPRLAVRSRFPDASSIPRRGGRPRFICVEGALDSPALRHGDDGERTAAAKGATTARGPRAAARRLCGGDRGDDGERTAGCGEKTARRRQGRREICYGGRSRRHEEFVMIDERFVR